MWVFAYDKIAYDRGMEYSWLTAWGALAAGVFGVVFGSFAGATVWRLRARQLRQDISDGIATTPERREFKKLEPLTRATVSQDRSQCLHCGHTLGFIDLIPLVSWLSTGGKCRYCRKPIGTFEPIIELTTGFLFVASVILWPHGFDTWQGITMLGVWLASLVVLMILFFYDLKWMLLPFSTMVIYGIMGLVFVGIWMTRPEFTSDHILSLLASVGILGGLYWILYRVSGGAWVGNGDYKLAIGLALFLGTWHGAFIALFAANLIGCLVMIPGMLLGKLTRTSRVAFGPFLIAGALVAFFWSDTLMRLTGFYL